MQHRFVFEISLILKVLFTSFFSLYLKQNKRILLSLTFLETNRSLFETSVAIDICFEISKWTFFFSDVLFSFIVVDDFVLRADQIYSLLLFYLVLICFISVLFVDKNVKLFSLFTISPINKYILHKELYIYIYIYIYTHTYTHTTTHTHRETGRQTHTHINTQRQTHTHTNIYLYINFSARVRYDTRSIFKRSLNRFEFIVFLLVD